MNGTQRAYAYVADLRKTGQWRKSYWYIVVADTTTKEMIGHQWRTSKAKAIEALTELNKQRIPAIIIRGSEA